MFRHSGLMLMISLIVDMYMNLVLASDFVMRANTFSKKKFVFPIEILPRQIAAAYLI